MGQRINKWGQLFSEISYAFELDYPPTYEVDPDDGVEYICFHKLTLDSLGRGSYKMSHWTFDTALWPRVKLLYKLFEKDNAIDVLYGKK